MPQLTRVRFCNIGHPHARIDDLTLPFHDSDGYATHSTVWRQNDADFAPPLADMP